ncbi:arginyl-tRNA synthetase [Liquorilactobacillus aquaticus DSM 21051]|uniref:Arginine--tRNA ligase n=1 Tax=Liquorilactobacillus aquaticus DSM 21051 TaxID=1423725 RepID=A0A0R2D7K9_9LACO|nr:arginine--tRNA ligase [Liquorilactobacillus aquaticus]KRM96649.1 arginyl-tRNA synthetase [Liquorilactobacillus aquaticus DSM 21051]
MNYKEIVVDALYAALEGQLERSIIEDAIENPKSLALGDFAFPAFPLARIFKRAPQIIASEIASKVDQGNFDKVQAVGPYVNFFLDKKAFSNDVLHQILAEGSSYGDQDLGNNGNVTIDMSSPNIAKPISMGHLRSTVIGNSIAKILEKTNYHPIKINHLGDWGTQFGKLIEAYKLWGTEEEVKADPINKLLEYYVRFHKEDVEHPELDDEARAWFKKLEDGDPEAVRLWKWFRSESLKSFMKIYNKLGVEFDSFNGEAFYNDKMDEVVSLLEQKKLLQESRGAQIVDLSKYDLNPALIKKTDGATLYITRDLAAAIYRKRTYNFVQSLYVVGNEQTNHFKQLKAVLKELGEEWSDDIHHIPFGLITQGGKKLSTRAGRVILLDEVLDDAMTLAKKQIEEKNPDLKNKEKVAKQVGVGAVIFHDLKNERMNNFDFDLDEVVRFEGETGPYVQYTHARAMSILRKSEDKALSGGKEENYQLDDEESWEVLRLLESFSMIVKRAVKEYEPSVVAKYSLHLAKSFNKYYAHTKILKNDEQLTARLALAKSVASVLKESLRLLGVQAPEEM